MPATIFYVLSLLFVIGLSLGVFVYFRRFQKKKQDQYEMRIKNLELELAAAGTQVAKEAQSIKTVQENSAYEKYAGQVIAQMDRGVIIINANRIVAYINDYAKGLLDLAAGTGVSYKEVIHIRAGTEADDFTLFEAAFIGKAQKLTGNYMLVSQHGTFPVSGTIIPIMVNNAVSGIVFIFEDDTKQALRVKEEQAFFSAAAHELRTPLTIIRMTISLLREKFETLPKDKIIEHLRRTDETTERLVRLVNEFLNISRIDQGRLEIKTEKFDMVTLTDEVIANLALLAKERNLYVHHEIEVSERMVVADRAKAAEVLSNLISNGLKYTIQGGLTITHAATSTTLTTTVTDTGPGISKESQSLLFKRFGQVGEAHQLVAAKSTGLGLYIAKKLAELMRGDVVLTKSEPGTGSTFAFTLPLR